MLNSIMDYIRQNHPDAASSIKDDIHWVKTSSAKKIGYTGATYTSNGWTVAIGHAVTAEIIHEVKAEYSNQEIVWQGTITSGIITENNFAKK